MKTKRVFFFIGEERGEEAERVACLK